MRDSDALLKLVEELVHNEPIRELLKKHKKLQLDAGNKEARGSLAYSGARAALLLAVKNALSNKVIPLEDVTEMVRKAEETASQHVFYYKPMSSAVTKRCGDGQAIVEGILGKDWSKRYSFPNFLVSPTSPVWADVRFGLPGKKDDWLLKLYTGKEVKKFVKTEKRAGNEVAEIYRIEPTRVVAAIRWNAPDLLEMRISRTDAKKDLKSHLSLMWRNIGRPPGGNPGAKPVLDEHVDFVEWDIRPATVDPIV